jgi:hypothetical protein
MRNNRIIRIHTPRESNSKTGQRPDEFSSLSASSILAIMIVDLCSYASQNLHRQHPQLLEWYILLLFCPLIQIFEHQLLILDPSGIARKKKVLHFMLSLGVLHDFKIDNWPFCAVYGMQYGVSRLHTCYYFQQKFPTSETSAHQFSHIFFFLLLYLN